MNPGKKHLYPDEKGAALVTSILALLLVTLLGFAMIASGFTAINISDNDIQQTEAFYISEAGLTHAKNMVMTAGASNFNAILQAGDGVAGTGDELSTQPAALTPIPQAGLNFGRGSYRISVSDDIADTDGNPNADSNGRILITATATGRDGASATTEIIVSVSSGPAILINSNLRLTANSVVRGIGGAIHSNGITDAVGTTCTEQYLSASAAINVTGFVQSGPGCGGAGVTRPNQPIIPPPTWNIPSYRANADYILGTSGAEAGQILDGTGALVYDTTTTGNTWINGTMIWTWNPATNTWSLTGNDIMNGTYYTDGSFIITGNQGTAGAPKNVTIFAAGHIEMVGNQYFLPDYQNFSMMAGTDLILTGNAGVGETNLSGISYAGHQVNFTGNPAITGVIIAASLADTETPGCACNPVTLSGGYMNITGNPKVTYNGGLFSSEVKVISWREVRY